MKRKFDIEHKSQYKPNQAKLTIAKERISLKISEIVDYEMKSRILNFIHKLEMEYDKLETTYTLRGFFDIDNSTNELFISLIGGYKDNIVLSVWEN